MRLPRFVSAAFLSALLVPSAHAITGPSNYWECILDRMPEANTDQEATSIRRQCRWDFSDYYWRRAIPKDEGIWPFTKKASDCLEKLAVRAKTTVAKMEMKEACQGAYPQ